MPDPVELPSLKLSDKAKHSRLLRRLDDLEKRIVALEKAPKPPISAKAP